MQALNQVSRVTGDLQYNRWAMELARTAQARFVTLSPSGIRNRMYWKMSIDLSYPLVPSMGQHDPLDGFITCAQLKETGEKDPEKNPDLDLKTELAEMARMCRDQNWQTDDPLGLGGLLSDAYRAAQLSASGKYLPPDLPISLLEEFTRHQPQQEEPWSLLRTRIERLSLYGPIRERIESFWLDRRNRAQRGWTDHREINMVMLATSLAPDGTFTLQPFDQRLN